MKPLAIAVLGLLSTGIATSSPAKDSKQPPVRAEYLSSEMTIKQKLPFSEAVRVGNMLYLSGMLALVPGTRDLAPGGIEAETRQTLENIRGMLERNGSSLDEVVKCTVMMADMAEWPKMNAVYVTFFTKHFPARSAMGVTGLALGAKVEIECFATVGDSRK